MDLLEKFVRGLFKPSHASGPANQPVRWAAPGGNWIDSVAEHHYTDADLKATGQDGKEHPAAGLTLSTIDIRQMQGYIEAKLSVDWWVRRSVAFAFPGVPYAKVVGLELDHPRRWAGWQSRMMEKTTAGWDKTFGKLDNYGTVSAFLNAAHSNEIMRQKIDYDGYFPGPHPGPHNVDFGLGN